MATNDRHGDLRAIVYKDIRSFPLREVAGRIETLFDDVSYATTHKLALQQLEHNYLYAADALEAAVKHLREQAAKFATNAKKSK